MNVVSKNRKKYHIFLLKITIFRDAKYYTIIDYLGIGYDVILTRRIPILTEAKPRSILVFSGQYHIIYNASIVNNCFII